MLLLVTFIAASLLCSAQEEAAPFTCDRPGAITGVDVMPQGRLQWETYLGWERDRIEDPAITTWTLHSSMLRYGISSTAELRLQANYSLAHFDGANTNGLSDLLIGTKVRLFDGWKAVPAIGLLANVYVPGNSHSDFLPEDWGGTLGLLFQNELTPWLSLYYEGDLTWSDTSRPEIFFAVGLGFQVSESVWLGIDQFNQNTSDGTYCWSELSVGWQVSPRIQLDLATDISLQYPARYHCLLVGLSWQLTKK